MKVLFFFLMEMLLILTTGCSVDPAFGENITDIDGNVYQTVIIGSQTWMVENLKTTHYQNGDTILNITQIRDSAGAYGNYDNNISNATTYGRLYNWYAVNDSRKIAPKGWHVPTKVEWQTLVDHLGGWEVAGGKLKERGSSHWLSTNAGATNETGFTALPGGVYDFSGFHGVELGGFWWSSTEYAKLGTAYFASMSTGSPAIIIMSGGSKVWGFSIRCVKD